MCIRDSYRAKLWNLENASKATLEILPYVNILSAGILDAENILNMKCNYTDEYDKLRYYYDEITNNYPNVKHIYSSKREMKSVSVNTLQCNYYNENQLYSSRVYVIDDIVDRIGGGDALTAGVIYSILNNKNPKYITEFSASSSVLKHSISGDANLVSIEDVEGLMNNGVGKVAR